MLAVARHLLSNAAGAVVLRRPARRRGGAVLPSWPAALQRVGPAVPLLLPAVSSERLDKEAATSPTRTRGGSALPPAARRSSRPPRRPGRTAVELSLMPDRRRSAPREQSALLAECFPAARGLLRPPTRIVHYRYGFYVERTSSRLSTALRPRLCVRAVLRYDAARLRVRVERQRRRRTSAPLGSSAARLKGGGALYDEMLFAGIASRLAAARRAAPRRHRRRRRNLRAAAAAVHGASRVPVEPGGRRRRRRRSRDAAAEPLALTSASWPPPRASSPTSSAPGAAPLRCRRTSEASSSAGPPPRRPPTRRRRRRPRARPAAAGGGAAPVGPVPAGAQVLHVDRRESRQRLRHPSQR